MILHLRYRLLPFLCFSFILFQFSSCGKNGSEADPWDPQIPGASASNHNESTQIFKTELPKKHVKILGNSQGITPEYEITFQVSLNHPLGEAGSLSLIAETETSNPTHSFGNRPIALLMSLTDESGKDYIHLSRQEGFGDCTQRGLNGANCRIEQPSAYSSLNLWKKRQGYGFSSTSVNTFPTCNWDQFAKTCAFNTDFFERGKKELKPGLFQAKYAVFYPERPIVTGIEYGTVKLTVIEKIAKHSDKKAIDLNIVLVGSKNIQDSHSESGRRNLNLLFTHVNNHFSQTQPGIKLGSIKSFEWTKEKQGDAFAQISIGKLGELFKKGSHIIPKDTGTQALNIFIVSNFVEGFIAGISGQINGPMLHGTESSGLAFASFNQLAQFNMNCPSVATQCTLEKQDAIFVDMATTITHEIGHFMGLFHTQERSGASNDELPDTPHCRLISNKGYILQESCRYDRSIHPVTGKSCNEVCKGYDGFNSFCPESPECEYNHVMWWTSKNFNPSLAQGDGNIFSLSSSIILNYSPFVQ